MIETFTDKNSQGQATAKHIDTLPDWGIVHVQVFGANTLYIGSSREELERPGGQSGQPNGIPVIGALGNVQLNWKGPLWAIGSAPQTFANIALPGRDLTGR